MDIDLWIDRTPANAELVWRALVEFGAPLDDLGIRPADFQVPDIVAQLGLPPNRIDVMTGITGLDFDAAWANRIEAELEGLRVPVLGRAELVANKRATGRDKDRVDLQGLEGHA